MSEQEWLAIDSYLEERHIGDDPALAAALKASAEAGLPDIAVSPTYAKMLQVLATAAGARTILEIGTLGGYSAIAMARALGDAGKLISLEHDPRHAEIARANLKAAGLADKVEIWIGEAIELLPKLGAASVGPFDFAFIDADKERIAEYFDWAVKLCRPGAMIVIDNVIRRGRVIDPDTKDPSVDGVRRFLDQVGEDDRVEATTIQTVGVKGFDGFSIAVVKRQD